MSTYFDILIVGHNYKHVVKIDVSNKPHSGVSSTKKHEKADDKTTVVIDFGKRTISNQNFSKIVALPKQALANCGGESAKHVQISLVHDKNEKFLKLRPICKPNEDDSA